MKTGAWRTRLACVAGVLLIAACGGGGGGSGSGGSPAAGASSGNGGAGSTASVSYSIALSPTSGQVGVGKTLPLTASVIDSNGTDVTASTTFSWSSLDGKLAGVAAASVPGGAVVTGMAAGNATIQVVGTVTAADNSTTQLSAQTASINVLEAGLTSYTLALPYPVLSMTNGQVLPVKASLIDSNGADVSGAVHDWKWASSTAAVQVAGSENVGTLTAVNTNAAVALSTVSVSVTAPNGALLAGAFPVSVFKSGVASYRLVLSQRGQQINALSVLNGYPQTVNSKVMRNDESDTTADFNGLWTFTTTSPTLSVSPDAATHSFTLGTSRANGMDAAQSVLQVAAASLTLTPRPRANLLVTEQPTWALVYNGPTPLVVPMPMGASVAVQLMHHGIDEGITGCSGWAWSKTGDNIIISTVFPPNMVTIHPLAAGPFTVTATCTGGSEQMPLSITLDGVVQ